MNLQLKDWRVKEISWVTNLYENSRNDSKSFDLSFAPAFTKENSREFMIGFKIGIYKADFDLKLEIVFVFEVDSDIDDDFKNSPFLKINAPAIAFPYVRSYISNLTLQSGYPPVFLPSINFVALSKYPGKQ